MSKAINWNLVERIGGTTWFVYPRPSLVGDYIEVIGVVNYPGNHPTLKYHASRVNRKDGPGSGSSKDLGHFDTLEDAIGAICRNEASGVIVEV